jgi:hypothetical protein
MRAVIPAQVVLYLMVCWTLAEAKRPWRSLEAATLTAVVAIGSGSSVHNLAIYLYRDAQAVRILVQDGDWLAARESLLWKLPVSWREDPTAEEQFWPQYFGDEDSFFYRVLARPPAIPKAGPAANTRISPPASPPAGPSAAALAGLKASPPAAAEAGLRTRRPAGPLAGLQTRPQAGLQTRPRAEAQVSAPAKPKASPVKRP